MAPRREERKELSEEEKRKAKAEFNKRGEVSEEEAEKTISRAKEFFERIGDNVPDSLKDIWDDVITLYQMLRGWYEGTYHPSWKTVSAIVVGLLYLITTFDVVPDFIPLIGWLDDAVVLREVIKYLRSEIDEFRVSRNERRDNE